MRRPLHMTADLFLNKSISTVGYALIRKFEPTIPSAEVFSRLGVVDFIEGQNSIQTLTPKTQIEASPNTYSGKFGMGEFPLHTDLAHWSIPPRYLVLRCIRGSTKIATHLLDGNILSREFGIDVLQRALVQPRRPMKNGRQLLRLLEWADDLESFRLRWDSHFLVPATGASRVVIARICAFLESIEPQEIALRDPGDTLIIDNWRWLHGRSPARAYANLRQIDRVYLGSLT